jgi:transposase
MKRLQAYKFQIEPNGEQLRTLLRFAGSCRFVYNKALATQKALYEKGEKKLVVSHAETRGYKQASFPRASWVVKRHLTGAAFALRSQTLVPI